MPVDHRSALPNSSSIQPFVDFLTGLLGVGRLVDEGLVPEELVDVALGAGEGLEDGALNLDEDFVALGVLGDDLNIFLLHLGVLEGTIWAKICSSSPEGMMGKLMTVTKTNISGG